MLKRAILCCTLTKNIPRIEGDFFGVDRGAFFLASQKIRMKVALGDFDSVQVDELENIKLMADQLIQLNPKKDESDSQVAIRLANEWGYQEIILIGALGKRMDHTYVNLQMMNQTKVPLIIIDENNCLFIVGEESRTILKKEYCYLSVFAMEDAIITLTGVGYPLENYKLTRENLIGLSNEIQEESCHLTVHQGKILVIQSKD